MKPERWSEVERLYHAALRRAEGDRRAFLRDVCGADEELQREVESLLAQPAASADAFLAEPAAVVAAQLVSDVGASVLTGRRLGTYQLQSLLGAGGMRSEERRVGKEGRAGWGPW